MDGLEKTGKDAGEATLVIDDGRAAHAPAAYKSGLIGGEGQVAASALYAQDATGCFEGTVSDAIFDVFLCVEDAFI